MADAIIDTILVLMSEQINHLSASPAVAILDGPYREVMDLLEQARSHAEVTRQTSATRRGPSRDRTRASCEALRVTTRLSQCLAWLLFQKAIHAGELPPEAALDPDKRLDGHAVCTAAADAEDDPGIPPELRRLLHRSRTLYERVSRLDRRIEQMASGKPN